MKRRCRLICASLIIILAVSCFAGCSDEPRSYAPNAAFGTQVLNDVLGFFVVNGKFAVMDRDDFGRQLFVYQAVSAAAPGPALIAVCVCQRADAAGYVYYYPSDFLLYQGSEKAGGGLTDAALIGETCSLMRPGELEALKAENDWGKPFNVALCDRVPIDCLQVQGPVKDSVKEQFFKEIDIDGRPVSFVYLTSDQYGRHIYFSGVRGPGVQYAAAYIELFYPDGRFDYVRIPDLLRYQDQMKAFKAENHWNQPISP